MTTNPGDLETYECAGGTEVGVDTANSLILHENDTQWHVDPELFDEPEEDPFGEAADYVDTNYLSPEEEMAADEARYESRYGGE